MINVVATHASQVTPSNCFYGISPVPQHMGEKKKKRKGMESHIFCIFHWEDKDRSGFGE